LTGKADFTEEEWTLLSEGPTSAGMIVIAADRGGSIRETFSMAKAYAEARREHGASQVLDDIVGEKPKVDKERAGSPEELKAHLLIEIQDAMELLRKKATPEEAEEYRKFVLAVANRVAEARKEGFMGLSGERVSEPEHQALDAITKALEAGTTPSE
jgi:hypothetical protein